MTVYEKCSFYKRVFDAAKQPAIDKNNEMMEEAYYRIEKNFRDIETRIKALDHQEYVKNYDKKNSLTRRVIPSVSIGGDVYKLEVDSLDCGYGVNYDTEECNKQYTGRTYKAPFRIILTGKESARVYKMLSSEISLALFDLEEPKIVKKKVVPIFEAYVRNTGELYQPTPFAIPEEKFDGKEYKDIDENIGKLAATLKVPYDAQRVRRSARNRAVKQSF